MVKPLCLLLFICTLAPISEAKNFKNSYLSFELPDQWNCQLKKKAYLCRYRVAKLCKANPTSKECKKQIKKSREALIVISAKEKSQVDTIEAFSQHFGEAKKINVAVGSSQSKVIHNKFVGIKKSRWVDSMHLGSELPHYYTRYLATINGEIAVLVSFTAHKLYYSDYSDEIFNGIKSLAVTTNNLSKVSASELGNKILSRPIDIPEDLLETSAMTDSGSSDGVSSLLFILSMVLAAVGIFIWFRSKKVS